MVDTQVLCLLSSLKFRQYNLHSEGISLETCEEVNSNHYSINEITLTDDVHDTNIINTVKSNRSAIQMITFNKKEITARYLGTLKHNYITHRSQLSTHFSPNMQVTLVKLTLYNDF